MTYRALANPSLYHCGYPWVVVDEDYNTISEHTSRQSATEAAESLNRSAE